MSELPKTTTEVAIPEPVAMPAGALESITRAEIDSQIATAHRFRRSVSTFLQQARTLATLDPETAAACNYTLPRDGKKIEGPGIRLAEIVAATWGNLRVGARVIGDDGRTIVAQGFCHDLESNVAMTMEVRRRITDRHGRRYSDDMVNVTANAACSIARRNAILAVVPRTLVDQLARMAKAAAVGTERTLADRRAKMVAAFATLGVPLDRVLARVAADAGVPKRGVEDIDLHDLEILIGLHTAITDGITTATEAFPVDPPAEAGDQTGTKSERLARRLKLQPTEAAPAAGGQRTETDGTGGDVA